MAIPTLLPSVILLALAAGSAMATDNPVVIDGRYGDEAGCHFAATGNSSGDGFFFLMDDEGVATAVSYCAFSADRKAVAATIEISAQCHEEGEEGTVPITLTLSRQGDSFEVSLPDGTRWGPLKRCLP
ncbi:hypothetical protein [Pannonibacter carbonis]|uniref:hypothetical protein n=1 Tax=Pannonibacter carbonis TaxID=2067569 RepID=UPI000D0FACB2|nr:hypothetical protein [Pannonibacter carbonis]